MKQLLKKVAVVCTVALATTLTIHAQQAQTIEYGRTVLQFDPSFTAGAAQLGAVLGGVGFSSVDSSGVIVFPVVSGAIDLQTSQGEVNHLGGLSISANGTQIWLQNFLIDTTAAPIVSALLVVNNKLVGRIPFLSFTFPPGVTLPLTSTAGVLQVNGIGVTLHPAAATALNEILHTNAISGGLTVGTMNVYLVLSPNPAS